MGDRIRGWLALACFFAASGAVANAHPLGNFTINHLAAVRTAANELHVRYVIDIAEIPTFQIMRATSPDGSWTAAQRGVWANAEVPRVISDLHVAVDDRPAELSLRALHSQLRPGAAGLRTLYWTADFAAPLAAGEHRIRIVDDVYGDRRIGWKDIIVAPQTEPTHELTSYPSALLGSPRRVRALSFAVTKDGVARAPVATIDEAPENGSGSNSIVRANALSEMFSSPNRSPLFVLFTMIAAFGLGALHAIEPGHGKALLAFTLVGSRATTKQAVILAAALTFAHTIGVLILGVVLFFAAGFVSEAIYPWITLGSGALIAVIGAQALVRNVRMHGRLREHDHGHDHDHGHTHSHAIAGDAPLNFRAAVAAAVSGGIAPCPAAIVVMLAALRLHQLGYGIVLIVIFSLGLASVLSGLGIAVVHGSAWVVRSGKFDRLVTAGPLLSALLISLVGAVLLAQGLVAQGIHANVWVLAGSVACAIAGYALAQTLLTPRLMEQLR